jgi:hypothetical protein
VSSTSHDNVSLWDHPRAIKFDNYLMHVGRKDCSVYEISGDETSNSYIIKFFFFLIIYYQNY